VEKNIIFNVIFLKNNRFSHALEFLEFFEQESQALWTHLEACAGQGRQKKVRLG